MFPILMPIYFWCLNNSLQLIGIFITASFFHRTSDISTSPSHLLVASAGRQGRPVMYGDVVCRIKTPGAKQIGRKLPDKSVKLFFEFKLAKPGCCISHDDGICLKITSSLFYTRSIRTIASLSEKVFLTLTSYRPRGISN